MQTYPLFASASSALGMVVLARSGRSVAFAVSGRLASSRAAKERQEASSQVMAKITGTESSVATKMVSRAKITPRS